MVSLLKVLHFGILHSRIFNSILPCFKHGFLNPCLHQVKTWTQKLVTWWIFLFEKSFLCHYGALSVVLCDISTQKCLEINENFTGITVDKMLCLPNHYWLILVQLHLSHLTVTHLDLLGAPCKYPDIFLNQKFSLFLIKHYSYLRFVIRKTSSHLRF